MSEPNWQGLLNAARIGQRFCPWCETHKTDVYPGSEDRSEEWTCRKCKAGWDVYLCLYEAAEVQWDVEGENEDFRYAINLATMKVIEL